MLNGTPQREEGGAEGQLASSTWLCYNVVQEVGPFPVGRLDANGSCGRLKTGGQGEHTRGRQGG